MKKIITKADILLFIALIALGLFLTAFAVRGTAGSSVRITTDGKLYGVYPLYRDDTITIDRDGQKNIVSIKDGSVYMEYSSCKNQVCVDTGKISNTNQSIICLPNRVAVTITGSSKNNGKKEGDKFDAVSQ